MDTTNPIFKAHWYSYTTVDGTVWTDLISGIQNVPLGHHHEVVTKAIKQVADAGIINSYSFPTVFRHKLENALPRFYPDFYWGICSTGTESIEKILQLIKIRRGTFWKGKVLFLPNSFHGKSVGTARARYGNKWGSDLFCPLDVSNLPEQGFDAIIYEPVQGLTGDIPDSSHLKTLCVRHGAYLIADEMITGFGRCGKQFMGANDADYIACGKGISSGLPITFIASKTEIGEIPTGWTTTGAGNSLCCNVAAATLEEIQGKDPMEFEKIARDIFPNVKGKGALLHIPVGKIPYVKSILQDLRLVALYGDNSIRLAPCLTFPLTLWRDILQTIRLAIEDSLI